MFRNGAYTPEQKMRFGKRVDAVEFATSTPYNDELSQKEYIDKYIRRGWRPAGDDSYELVNPEGTRKKTISRQGMKDYLDVVLNRGEYKANYDLPEGANVVPERVTNPATEPAPEPDVPSSAGEPDEFEGMDGAQVAQKLLKFVESREYDTADKQLLYSQGRAKEAMEILLKLKGDGIPDLGNPEVKKAFDYAVDCAGVVREKIEDLRKSAANEAVKKALKVKAVVSIKRHISQNRYPFKKKQELANLVEGIDGFESIVSEKVDLKVKDVAFWHTSEKSRSSYNENGGAPVVKCGAYFYAESVVHELGHHLEWAGKGVQVAAMEFFKRRTQGEAYVPLKNFGRGYRDDELCKPDKFVDPYIGKFYSDGSTEVVSVGLACYYSDPVGFLRRDPEHFAFIYDVVHGKFS
jgi:hypothetical protein